MGASKMRNPDLRRVRALAMMQRRMANISLSDIAQEFNVKAITVSNELAWAKKQGLIENYQQQLLNELVPEAIKTVKVAIADGNVKAAIEVLKGTGLLSAKPMEQPTAPDGGAESLEIYVRKIGGAQSGRTDALPTIKEVAVNEAESAPSSDGRRLLENSVIDAEAATP